MSLGKHCFYTSSATGPLFLTTINLYLSRPIIHLHPQSRHCCYQFVRIIFIFHVPSIFTRLIKISIPAACRYICPSSTIFLFILTISIFDVFKPEAQTRGMNISARLHPSSTRTGLITGKGCQTDNSLAKSPDTVFWRSYFPKQS